MGDRLRKLDKSLLHATVFVSSLPCGRLLARKDLYLDEPAQLLSGDVSFYAVVVVQVGHHVVELLEIFQQRRALCSLRRFSIAGW